jgi:GNAT superfamily N-acetyltransferase
VTGNSNAAPRPLSPRDREPTWALVSDTLCGTPYLERVTELLTAAERDEPECRALVIARDATVTALALYGPVAGAADVWRVGMLLLAPKIESREVGRVIIEVLVQNARLANARLLVAELPADAVIGRTLTVLRANGFRQEARIPDFYREGVAQLFLRREIL